MALLPDAPAYPYATSRWGVYLGELRTDEAGDPIVLRGRGSTTRWSTSLCVPAGCPSPRPSFAKDIYPLFARFQGLGWVNEGFADALGRTTGC